MVLIQVVGLKFVWVPQQPARVAYLVEGIWQDTRVGAGGWYLRHGLASTTAAWVAACLSPQTHTSQVKMTCSQTSTTAAVIWFQFYLRALTEHIQYTCVYWYLFENRYWTPWCVYPLCQLLTFATALKIWWLRRVVEQAATQQQIVRTDCTATMP